jgi:hypothetical protein
LRIAGEPDLREVRAMSATMRRLLLNLCLAAAAAANPAVADPRASHPVADAVAPSGHVGRVASTYGKVELRPAGSTAVFDVTANYPVGAHTAVRTAENAGAALEFGADTVDLSAQTAIEIPDLPDPDFGLTLVEGHLGIGLNRAGSGDVGVYLAPGEVWLERPGTYEIVAAGGAPPRIAVFAGRVRLYAGGVAIVIAAGEAMELSVSAPIASRIAPADRETRPLRWHEPAIGGARPVASQLVSPEMTGLGALAAAGRWQKSAAYGEVWLPGGLPADWAPYRDGHWRWVAPWGWTWIDDQPWGFAPFHFGRWAHLEGGWVWVPGSFESDPIYMPAAVAFLGTPGIGVSYAGGGGPAIGWFPLAPGEAYWPGYSKDLDYIRALNRGAVADLAGIRPQPDGRLPVEVVDRPFANRLSASVVPRSVFVGAEPVAPALIDLPKERLANVPIVMGSPRLGPPVPPPEAAIIATTRPQPPAARGGSPAARRAAWLVTVEFATIRSRLYRQAARLRHLAALHLGLPRLAEASSPHRHSTPRRAHGPATHQQEALR